MERKPGKYTEGQLRTLQRRIKRWRATKGPDKEVFFPQQHRPGEAMQTDFTSGNKLGVTIGGEPFPHLLCHPVLPYSNWEWATVCRSESLLAIRRGVQEAVFRLGRVPEFHQVDHSTAERPGCAVASEISVPTAAQSQDPASDASSSSTPCSTCGRARRVIPTV